MPALSVMFLSHPYVVIQDIEIIDATLSPTLQSINYFMALFLVSVVTVM